MRAEICLCKARLRLQEFGKIFLNWVASQNTPGETLEIISLISNMLTLQDVKIMVLKLESERATRHPKSLSPDLTEKQMETDVVQQNTSGNILFFSFVLLFRVV